jgi:hypothetical protein
LLSLPLLALFCPISIECGPNQRVVHRLIPALGLAAGVSLMARLIVSTVPSPQGYHGWSRVLGRLSPRRQIGCF